MIGIYNDAGDRLAMGYNGLTVNDEVYPVSSATVNPRWDAVTEPHSQADGMEAYGPRRMVDLVRVDGIVKADSVAQLHDRIDALNAAFDPVLATDGDDTNDPAGFLPFTFSLPTEDDTNYASGLKPLQYYARSVQLPVDRVSKFEGTAAQYALILQAVDPRRYLQTATNALIGSSPYQASNVLATYPSWPTLILTMAGAGSALWQIDNGHETLILDLSGMGAGQTVRVDMRKYLITVDGVRNQGLFVSGRYLLMRPEINTLTINTFSGISAVNFEWRRAFA